jgi:hypothetical protein
VSEFDFEPQRFHLPPRYQSPGAATMVGQVVTASPAVGKFMLVNPVSVFGTEGEGNTGVTTANTGVTVPVYLVGPGVPKTGDMLVCRFVDYRWVAERKKVATPPPVNPCNCTWPRVLTYNGQVGQAQAAFYFVNASYTQPEPSYTLTYGPRPADIPQNLQLYYYNYPGGVRDPYYVTMPDKAWFSAPIAGTLFGNPTSIYFYMWVQQCQSYVMVIDSPYGAASMPDGSKGAGNNIITYVRTSCNPFQMKLNVFAPLALTGTHGSDDIVPDTTGGAGYYFNPRIGL